MIVKCSRFFLDVLSEVKKISWFPSKDLFGASLRIVVIVACASVGFLFIDWCAKHLVTWFIAF
ncbi:preprotein translocase subunit SecE [Candidatus Sneabacter namystus]|uniref:Preprotein translocase subunit SecE n=1 Tax=Candidatus Sneabacter namystus TaxID=2601646 RepID=A0A5C0UJG0_9RICK|nr:preprotein translocase subunit SecE [Candidatus Sneabacter namystus]QEK39741.1 preprotein translocase subunit SecE [Candidatus Sneabacter namystus]